MAIIGGRAHNQEEAREVCGLGYPFVEISLIDSDEVLHQTAELLKLREEYGIFYLVHYPNEDNPLDPGILEKRFVPKIKKLIGISSELGISKGILHFWMDKRWAPPGLIPVKINLLSELVSFADQAGIVLCLENLTERHDSFSDIFDAIPKLRMTLDIGHGELLSSENTSLGFIRNLFPKIAHIHVHDNHGGKGIDDDLHLALGQGRIDYPGIFSLLKEKSYDATVTMEVKPVDMPHTRKEIERYLG